MSAQKGTHSAALLPAIGAELVIEQRKTSSPGPDEILVRNHVISTNPLDVFRQLTGFLVSSLPTILGAGMSPSLILWTYTLTLLTSRFLTNSRSPLDVAGTVVDIGPSVTQFKVGDRVCGHSPGFVTGNLDHGAYQEYTIMPETSAARIPDGITFSEGAAVPTVIGTAAMTLFDSLSLPLPTATVPAPLSPDSPAILIWGGASAVGSATIQLARLAGLTVYTTASERHHGRLRSLGAHYVVDYTSPSAVDDIVAAVKRDNKEIPFALDAVTKPESLPAVLRILDEAPGPDRRELILTLPWPEDLKCPSNIRQRQVRGEGLWNTKKDLSKWLYSESLPAWFENGSFKAQPQKIVEGGLSGLNQALVELRNGVSAVKLMVELE